ATQKIGVIEPSLYNRGLLRAQMAYQRQQRDRIRSMLADLHTGHGNASLGECPRHGTGLQESNDFIFKLVTVHRRDQIDQAALGTTGVEARDQMTDSDRQRSATTATTGPRVVAGRR